MRKIVSNSKSKFLVSGRAGEKFLRVGRIALFTALLAGIVLVGCDSPYSRVRPESGTLRVVIGTGTDLQPLTLLPDTEMEATEYHLRGNGPSGASFQTSTAGSALTIHDLQVGDWDIEVSAVNSEGLEIGYGESSSTIEAGTVNEIAVSVRPLRGTGSLALSVSWPAAEVQNASLDATLTHRNAQAQQLHFEFDAPGQASYSNPAVNAGYYTLLLQLRDGETVVAGAVETVRIVHKGHTEGTFNFDDLNHPTGEVSIVVTPRMDLPLEVSLSDAVAVLPYGSSMTVSAAVSNADSAEVVYTWYLNGGLLSSGDAAQVGADLAVGSYRLDVVAFTTDGLRSGSSTHTFRVE